MPAKSGQTETCSRASKHTIKEIKKAIPAWLRVGIAVFAVAWGGNQFTPLLVMYQEIDGLSTGAVDMLLAAYVFGIVPALLIGGPVSDRYGRRPLMLPAPLLTIMASVLLAAGASSPVILFIGRVVSGIALGLVMVVGGSWIKELSQAPFENSADEYAGARRASICLTSGFGLGAAVAAAIAQFSPIQAVMPYLAHIAISVVGFGLLVSAPESHASTKRTTRLLQDLRIPSSKHRRFIWVVVPMAPWVFGCAGSAYAILPGLVGDHAHGLNIGFSGLLCLIALGTGVGIQQIGKKIDDTRSARAVVVALIVTVPGMALAGWAALTLNPWIAIVAAATLGAAYGLLLVSGLQEVQRIAGPADLAGLTAVYYSLTYLGFFVPAGLAALNTWLTYPVMFTLGCVMATVSLTIVIVFYRKHLPVSRNIK